MNNLEENIESITIFYPSYRCEGNRIYKDKNKKFIGSECYGYFKANHSIEEVSQKLIKYLAESDLKARDLLAINYDKKSFIHYLHSFLKQFLQINRERKI